MFPLKISIIYGETGPEDNAGAVHTRAVLSLANAAPLISGRGACLEVTHASRAIDRCQCEMYCDNMSPHHHYYINCGLCLLLFFS